MQNEKSRITFESTYKILTFLVNTLTPFLKTDKYIPVDMLSIFNLTVLSPLSEMFFSEINKRLIISYNSKVYSSPPFELNNRVISFCS